MDNQGYRTFVSGRDLKKILKFANLKGFAIYFDPNGEPWSISKSWSKMSPEEWDAHFLMPVQQSTDKMHGASTSVPFLLRPVNGHLKSVAFDKSVRMCDGRCCLVRYHQNRHVKGHVWPETEPTRLVEVSLRDVDLVLSQRQYEHIQNLLSAINIFQVLPSHV